MSNKPTYTQQVEATSTGDGMSSRIQHNGIVVLTDRRLLWMEVKTAVAKPKSISAAFALGDIANVAYDKPNLSVRFADGSQGGIHTSAMERPADFVAAWRSTRSA